MKRVYSAESLIDGQMIADLLIARGIPAMLFNQNAQGALGELPVSQPEVWIERDPDSERAQTIIAQHQHIEITSDQLCPQCAEQNPSTFEFCWQCQHLLA